MENKTIFKTAYGKREPQFSEPGCEMHEEFGYEIDKYGQKVFVKTGEYNVYAMIQESLEETKIENILQRVAMGDNSVMRPDGIYADISDAPKNLIEARQQMQKLENVWNGLDNDIKKKYDFSVEKFIGASGTESWLLDMGLIEKKAEPLVETPKTEGGTEE